MISRRESPGTATRRRVGERGVTMIELAVAMGLVGLALAGIYGFISTGHRSARTTNDFVQAQMQVRAGLDNLVDEIRWAQSVTAATGGAVTLLVPQATPFSIGSPYTVTFAYDAAADTVTRQEDPDAAGPQPLGPAVVLATNVVQRNGADGLALEYFDAAGTSLGAAPPDLTAVVRVRITIHTTRNGVSRSFAGDAALRGR